MRKPAEIVRRLLPGAVRRRLRRVRSLFGAEEASAFPSIEGTLRYLRDWGFSPRTVVDVGAYQGEWTRLVKEIFPAARVLMVEPQTGKQAALRQVCDAYPGEVVLSSELLGPEDGRTVEFAEMETGSSVYEERSPVAREKTRRTVATLDSVVRSAGWSEVDLLKLDVQGYELEVLKGAASVLPTCEFVLMEASLIPVNQGCPLIAEVIGYMAGAGFRLLDFCSQIRRRDGALWQTDLMFVNERSRWLPSDRLTRANWWLPDDAA
jgi:FkbM family methyltransferase